MTVGRIVTPARVNHRAAADHRRRPADRSRITTILTLAAALLALPAGGCVASDRSPGDAAGDAGANEAPVPPDLETRVALRNAAGEETRAFRTGEPISFVITLHNRADGPRGLTLPTSQTHDCIVYRGDGAKRTEKGRDAVWRYSQGRMFAQVLTELTLAPGESRSFSTIWKQTDAQGRPVVPGDYQVVGLVPGGAPGCRAEPVSFTIRAAAAPVV